MPSKLHDDAPASGSFFGTEEKKKETEDEEDVDSKVERLVMAVHNQRSSSLLHSSSRSLDKAEPPSPDGGLSSLDSSHEDVVGSKIKETFRFLQQAELPADPPRGC